MVENQLSERLKYLAIKYNVFDTSESVINSKIKKFKNEETPFEIIFDNDNEFILGVIYDKISDIPNVKNQKIFEISDYVFDNIVNADPTKNKSYVQWMLNTFIRLLKENKRGIDYNITSAIRFVKEDLQQANTYIKLFEENKRKKKFKELCNSSYILKNVKDPTDINQFKSLSQLFDAVDPFIERDPTELERLLKKFVDAGQAEIPFRDRQFTLYIPYTTNASVVFEKFANWCTAKPGNGMFKNYTQNNRRPDNTYSKIYIIINNKFFDGASNELYQIHFETNQIKDRHNSQNVSIFENVINKSEGLSNFFYDELIPLAKLNKNGLDNNRYLDFLISFGFCDSLFEMIDDETPTIRFMNREIPKLPDITRFKLLDQLIITNAKLVELHPSIGELKNLEMLVLTENRIKQLPDEIGQLKNLTFLNIIGNPIEYIPEDIKYLDKSNGGSLFRLAVKKEEIGVKNYKILKQLLPTTKF